MVSYRNGVDGKRDDSEVILYFYFSDGKISVSSEFDF